MKDFVARIQKAQNKLDSECEEAHKAIADKVEFDFAIQHMAGDGVVVLDIGTSRVAPLDRCLLRIKNYGSLSKDDHNAIAI